MQDKAVVNSFEKDHMDFSEDQLKIIKYFLNIKSHKRIVLIMIIFTLSSRFDE